MKISELIAKLQAIQDEHGDVAVKMFSDDEGTGSVSGVEYYEEIRRLRSDSEEERVVFPARVVLYSGDDQA